MNNDEISNIRRIRSEHVFDGSFPAGSFISAYEAGKRFGGGGICMQPEWCVRNRDSVRGTWRFPPEGDPAYWRRCLGKYYNVLVIGTCPRNAFFPSRDEGKSWPYLNRFPGLTESKQPLLLPPSGTANLFFLSRANFHPGFEQFNSRKEIAIKRSEESELLRPRRFPRRLRLTRSKSDFPAGRVSLTNVAS